MLMSFRFLPSDKEIYWNLAGINYPTVGKEGIKAEMPMKLEAIPAWCVCMPLSRSHL